MTSYAPNADFDADFEYLIIFSIDCTVLLIFLNNRFESEIFDAAYLLNRLSKSKSFYIFTISLAKSIRYIEMNMISFTMY